MSITLEVLNPKGKLAHPEVSGLFAPRPTDLEGKRIALLSEKPDSIMFFNAMETLLKKRFPTATILRFPSAASPMLGDNTAEVAANCDCWMQGVKTSTSSHVDYDVIMEKRGVPGVMFSVDSLVPQKRCVAEANGIPTIRIVSLPALDYFKAKADQERMNTVAAAAFEEAVQAMIAPLTEAEQHPPVFTYDYGNRCFSGESQSEVWENFQQFCVDEGWGDGFPVTPPTREAVDKMLSGISFPSEEEIGIMMPRDGIATVEKIAINAVMAGAKPEYLPVIIAVIRCITDHHFNQFHINTGPIPAIWVSGPIIRELGMNNDVAYMAPGNRANSTIARAVALCQINIGWRELAIYADPGGPGSPVNYTNYFIPEHQELSPWPSYAVDAGFAPEDSTVTVSETLSFLRGPCETLYLSPFEEALEDVVRCFKPSAIGPSRNSGPNYRYLVVLHPTFASQLQEAGYTRESFIRHIYQKNAIVWDEMTDSEREECRNRVAAGAVPGLTAADLQPGFRLEPFTDFRHVAVMVSGNAAGGTLIFSTFTGSTAKFGDCPEDFIARPFMNKRITGATLTKSGR